MRYNLLVCGVGGQGILLLTRVIGTAAMLEGYTVYTGEVHGMAQRGGSVISTVRIGDVYGPIIPYGETDMAISLERIEILRHLKYLSQKTTVVLSLTEIHPLSVTLGEAEYPSLEQEIEHLKGSVGEVYIIDSYKILKENKLPTITENIVMLGAAFSTGKLPLKSESLEKAIEENVPQKYLEVNLKAFQAGIDAEKRKI
ncbi:indolepyruvate ferredoxin oxidoreductase subunit beta [archaeon]|nr:MAG: indolepyruvate ferredoxin oxidoreductase subunit beta [archaeon]RLG65563.1 MAG: indolepyruvate ferredoxin oxidoreductase subunit beta [archaeon]